MPHPDFETLHLEQEAGVCTLTINRPKKLNALNNTVLDELGQAAEYVQHNDEIQALIITGSGEKAFVAGADIKELSTLDAGTGQQAAEKGQGVFARIEALGKPVVAVVNGYALGGGTELALACHIRIATSNAMFGLPEVSLGLIPGYGGTQRLTALVGKGRALEMILSGRMVKADEAVGMGLANALYGTKSDALKQAHKLISSMLKHSPVALQKAIQAVHAAGSPAGFEVEAERFGELCGTQDFKEGTAAFLEKRKPEFKGH
ncbi:MAG: enoyl-CoA hydratase/isomerase family protein [Cyclonatronaceae bacterium]